MNRRQLNSRRSAFTFVEAMMITVLAVVVLGSIFFFLYTGSHTTSRTSDQMDAVTEVRLTLNRVLQEVRESRHILYPAPGQKTQNALCLVNGLSEVVMYRLTPAVSNNRTGKSFNNLVRFKRGGREELVLTQVSRFDITASNPTGGDESLLVHCVLTRTVAGNGPRSDSAVSVVSSASRHTNTCRCLTTELEASW